MRFWDFCGCGVAGLSSWARSSSLVKRGDGRLVGLSSWLASSEGVKRMDGRLLLAGEGAMVCAGLDGLVDWW